MSGIYISGMEMPKRCQECPFERPYNGYNCAITHKSYSWGLTGRPSDCPLVLVPPHGRLIDAEALFDFILNIYKTAQGDKRKAYRDVLDTIVAAGDVIPAEEGE